METLTTAQVSTTVYVLFILFGGAITLDKVIDIFKKWRAPSTDTAKKLDTDKRRLDEHEEQIAALKESNHLQSAALMALLDHELHNGNTDQMQKARDDIMHYLQSK